MHLEGPWLSTTGKKKGKKKNTKKKVELKEETRHSVWGIFFIVLALIITLSVFKMAGMVGDFIYSTLSSIFGFGYYILPIILAVIGFSFLKEESHPKLFAFYFFLTQIIVFLKTIFFRNHFF